MIDDMKVDELKAELDRLGIEYPAAAKKPELIELLKESE
ncbi:MAG: HeH/LEM domain-containing protein [Enterococcus mundtii]|nr:HeH/LEM domain-containing protein [Enterococcus mundtii]